MQLDHNKVLQEFDDDCNSERVQRQRGVDDRLFVHEEAGQWEDDIIELRGNRPMYTIDRISPAIDQLIGDHRQNKTGLKVEPLTNAEKETAITFTGLIRGVERMSNAQNAYDSAFLETVECGYGGWRVITEFENDTSFEQRILIKSIDSAVSSLFFDSASTDYDKRDSMRAWVTTSLPIDLFKKQYPKAAEVDFSSKIFSSPFYNSWFVNNSIRIAEYWYKEPIKRKIGLLNDGRVIDLKEEKDALDELLKMGFSIVREREVESFKIFVVKLNGVEFLNDPEPWAGKFFPLVPMFGKQAVIENKRFSRGIVRKAKDAQRILNYTISASVEASAMVPKNPFWFTPQKIKGHENSWRSFPTKNTPFLAYNTDSTDPGPPRQTGSPPVQQALIEQTNQAERSIQATTGIFSASLGDAPRLESGKAKEAEQRMGDRGSYVFQSNYEKSRIYTGDILVDLISKIWTTEQIKKVVGNNEESEDVEVNKRQVNEINQPILDEQTGKQIIVNDLSQGEFGVTVVTGPAYSTQRQETASQLIELASSSETIQKLALDIVLKNMNLNEGEELTKRVRKQMIMEGLVEPTEEEVKELGLDQPKEPDPMDSAVVDNLNMQTERLIAEIKNKDADTQKKIYESQKITVEAIKDLLIGYEKKKLLSDTDVELLEGQQAIIQESQIDTLQGAELAESSRLTDSQ